MGRISRGEMFMRIAQIVSARGTCDRAQVGAVIAHEGRVISIGYNGSAPGAPHCDDVGHQMVNGHCIRTRHAEVNAINFAAKLADWTGERLDVDMYVTHLPCVDCAKYIAHINKDKEHNLNIKSVIYGRKYPESICEAELIERYKILLEGGVVNFGELEV